jgi:hypothetical protein
MWPTLKSPQVSHLAVGRVLNDRLILLPQLDAQESIVIGRLLFRRNSEPVIIRIKWLARFAHSHTSTLQRHSP